MTKGIIIFFVIATVIFILAISYAMATVSSITDAASEKFFQDYMREKENGNKNGKGTQISAGNV